MLIRDVRWLRYSVLLLGTFVVACGDASDKPPVFTQLNALLAHQMHRCKDALIGMGNELIGDKHHFLQLDNSSADTLQPLLLSGVLLYRDRLSQLRLDAYPVGKEGEQQCLVSYQLNYHFDEPCLVIREEAFNKWEQKGVLGDDSHFYVNGKNNSKVAYLSNIKRSTQCLVTVKEVKYFPLHK